MQLARTSAVAGSILVSGLALWTPTARALNFRLQTMTVQEDGFTREHSYFQGDSDHKIMIDFPGGWATTSDDSSITSTPRNILNSEVRVEKSPVAPATLFKDKGLDAYRTVVTKAVPQGAVGFQFLDAIQQPLPIFNWKDYEFLSTYQFFGQVYKRSTVFINLNDREQIMITAVAQAADFDTIHKAALDIARSWSPMPSNNH